MASPNAGRRLAHRKHGGMQPRLSRGTQGNGSCVLSTAEKEGLCAAGIVRWGHREGEGADIQKAPGEKVPLG